ncbi:MAG: hypothetical protein GC186_02585 [Rhodobacteraceae bacterium]|nr:hypothetical protein [Paracoccaceae bacterium]
MSFIEDLADDLARDTLAACDELGDDRFYEQVSKSVGVLSPTLQEAFMTSIRMRLAERRGRRALEEALSAFRAGKRPE